MIYTVSFKWEGGLVIYHSDLSHTSSTSYFCLWFWGSKKEIEYRSTMMIKAQEARSTSRSSFSLTVSLFQWKKQSSIILHKGYHIKICHSIPPHINHSFSFLVDAIVSFTCSTCLSVQDLTTDALTAVSAISSSHSGRPFRTKYIKHPLLPLAV